MCVRRARRVPGMNISVFGWRALCALRDGNPLVDKVLSRQGQPGAQMRQRLRPAGADQVPPSGWFSPPLATHRCCQLSPDWLRSQFITANTPIRRVC